MDVPYTLTPFSILSNGAQVSVINNRHIDERFTEFRDHIGELEGGVLTKSTIGVLARGLLDPTYYRLNVAGEAIQIHEGKGVTFAATDPQDYLNLVNRPRCGAEIAHALLRIALTPEQSDPR